MKDEVGSESGLIIGVRFVGNYAILRRRSNSNYAHHYEPVDADGDITSEHFGTHKESGGV